MELLRRFHYQNLILALALLAALPAPAPALAQDPDCVWENVNCTPTPTATPTGTITPIPPTSTPTLQQSMFAPPEYDVPTSIPALTFPTPPPPLQFTPIPAPSPVSINTTPIPSPSYSLAISPALTSTVTAISTTLNISYTTPLTFQAAITGSTGITGDVGQAVGDVSGFIGQAVSMTNWLTGEIAAMQGTETITIIQAPAWYAPAMPRPIASVGWTFEVLTDPDAQTKNFTLASWAGFFGYIVTLPFQIIKSLWQLVANFGPFGLYLGWLLIIFLIVAVIHFQVFVVQFVFTLIRLIVRVIEILGGWIPTGG